MASPSVTDLQPPKLAGTPGKSPAEAMASAKEAAKAPVPKPGNTPPASAGPLNDPFSALDDIISGKASAPAPPPAPPAPKPAAPAPKPPDPAPKPEAPAPKTEPEPPKPADKPADPALHKSGRPMKPVEQLRNAYEESKRRVKELEQSIEALKAAPPPEDPLRKTLAEEKAALAKALEARENRLSELEEEIRYTNYTKSTEFAEQYQKPYEDAWKKAIGELSELTVMDEEEGTSRTPTPADLVAICNLPLGEARTKARAMFGDSADDIMAHRRKIRELFDAQTSALEKARAAGAERDKKRQEESARQRQVMQQKWVEYNREAEERFPSWFKPDEADPQGNELLAKGYALADQAFSGANLPAEELVRLHSAIRNKAAGFDRMVYRNRKLEQRIAALEAELQAFKESEPGAGAPSGGKVETQGGSSNDWDSEIDALDSKR